MLAAKSVGLIRSEPHGNLNVTILAGPGVARNSPLFDAGMVTIRRSTEQAAGSCHPPGLFLHSLPWGQVTLTLAFVIPGQLKVTNTE